MYALNEMFGLLCRALCKVASALPAVFWRHPLPADSNWGRYKLLLPAHLVRKPAVKEWGMFCSSAFCRTRRLHRKIASRIPGKKSCCCGERQWTPATPSLETCRTVLALQGALEPQRWECLVLGRDADCLCLVQWVV